MLDFGWAELLVIIVVLVFVIGPQDVPKLMHGLGRLVRRLTYMKYAVSQQLDQMMGDVDPHEVNNVMRPQAQQDQQEVPVVNSEDESEAAEDEDYEPEIVSAPQPEPEIDVKPKEDDPLLSSQQDFFSDTTSENGGKS